MNGFTATKATVGLAVLTYQREELVCALLPELARQAQELAVGARVIVVDNDPGGGARPAVQRLKLPVVTYLHEPSPGIAAARNAAIDAAVDLDAIVFIDDDETPDRDWLLQLVRAHQELGGTAIAGAVVRTYAIDPPPWILAARAFDRRRLPTGTQVSAASTANLLLDLEHVRRYGIRFDDRLGISGGSDHLFTRQICLTGGTIFWCDEAVVWDPVPPGRLTGRWTLARAYRSGNTATVVNLMLAQSPSERLRVRTLSLGGGLARVVAGGGRAMLGLVASDVGHRGRGAWTAARGAGMLGGAIGHHYLEYKRS